ncbi:MAG TPA: nucleoside/nucleotide kinase family protein [Mycobacteriales bacterium]|nr:nucleoside/nucleotide kinase family protein [Mycobacteriales bacterium]
MDGFHLPNAVLADRRLTDRKGAPETFDVAGYLDLLGAVRAEPPDPLYAPSYRRVRHEPVPGAHTVATSVRLVIGEGNYLLLDRDGWAPARALLDQVWFVSMRPETARARLVGHLAGGLSRTAVEEWVDRVDRANADLVNGTAHRADLRVELPELAEFAAR